MTISIVTVKSNKSNIWMKNERLRLNKLQHSSWVQNFIIQMSLGGGDYFTENRVLEPNNSDCMFISSISLGKQAFNLFKVQ